MYMSTRNVMFLVVCILVILGSVFGVIAALNSSKHSKSDRLSKGCYGSGEDSKNDNNQGDLEDQCEHDPLEKHTRESTRQMTENYVDNNALLSFDEACSVLEDRMRSCIRNRRIRGIADFKFIKDNTFWQKSHLQALDSEGYCLVTATTDFSSFSWSREDFDPFKIKITSCVRKMDDNIGEKGVHVGAHSASLEEYNKWLKKFLKRNEPVSNYSSSFYYSGRFVVVDDPDNYPDMTHENMCGANSLRFIIPKKYDVKKYAKKFRVGHCDVFGWSKGVAVNYGRWVPVYTDTIDKMKNVVLDPKKRKYGDKMFISASVSRSGEIFYRNVPEGVQAVQVNDTSVDQVKRMLDNGDYYQILKSIFVVTDKEILAFDDILAAKKCFPENVWSKFIGEESQDDSASVSNSDGDTEKFSEDMSSVW